MRIVARALCLFYFAGLQITSAATPVTVVLDYDQPYSSVSLAAMRSELQRLLKPVGVSLDLQVKSTLRPHSTFSALMMFKMKGSCSMQSIPIGAVLDERGPLGSTFLQDGELLSFGQVDCDRVRSSLEKVLDRSNPFEHQIQYGFALSRVLAHEMYHILTRSPIHTQTGVTKESLSASELLHGVDYSKSARIELEKSLNGHIR